MSRFPNKCGIEYNTGYNDGFNAALERENKQCLWKTQPPEHIVYVTQCGYDIMIDDPNVVFCPYCGKRKKEEI
jgi:rubrerythrin